MVSSSCSHVLPSHVHDVVLSRQLPLSFVSISWASQGPVNMHWSPLLLHWAWLMYMIGRSHGLVDIIQWRSSLNQECHWWSSWCCNCAGEGLNCKSSRAKLVYIFKWFHFSLRQVELFNLLLFVFLWKNFKQVPVAKNEQINLSGRNVIGMNRNLSSFS